MPKIPNPSQRMYVFLLGARGAGRRIKKTIQHQDLRLYRNPDLYSRNEKQADSDSDYNKRKERYIISLYVSFLGVV